MTAGRKPLGWYERRIDAVFFDNKTEKEERLVGMFVQIPDHLSFSIDQAFAVLGRTKRAIVTQALVEYLNKYYLLSIKTFGPDERLEGRELTMDLLDDTKAK